MKKLLFIIIPVLFSCKESLDVYLGIPLQPTFDENTFKPGLNIFGVLRTDSTLHYNNSFLIVQKVLPAVGDSTNWDVDSASAVLTEETDNNVQDNIHDFVLSDKDGAFEKALYRPDGIFKPKPGEIYSLECYSEGLPTLYARTIIPNKPVKAENSEEFSHNALSFELQRDTTYFMADIYTYYNATILDYQRLSVEPSSNTKVTVPILSEKPDSILIFTYDYNLAVYYLTSNTSLNFNKYRASFSTVENGYGVLGSINHCVLKKGADY